MKGLIILILLIWLALLLIEWLIYRLQGRQRTRAQYILPCVALLGGAIVIMISVDIGGWNGIGYALLGVSIATSGLLTLITTIVVDVVIRRRRRNE
ncbi:YesK family protein [Paenibacillus pabuli]|uniref:YesK family protein n=1 Tax=Paenibacillus pabuli TaxID=1472 RepID=UPI000785C0B4|nr:YesK family protein [Paenibacillus pabuli]MEC0126406.1 YesK family protein [Paenibacillus pabuli]